MITSITIKGVASYDQAQGIQINDLKKVNFFFGFNGSGKSTIARYLDNLSLEASLQSPAFSNCTNVGYDPSIHEILTFNEEFIDVNFRRSNEFKGVFSLNESNTSIDQQIKKEEVNIQQLNERQNIFQTRSQTLEDSKNNESRGLLEFCWSKRTAFDTFSKLPLAYSGSRKNHFDYIRSVLQDLSPTQLTINELAEKYRLLYEKPLSRIEKTIDVKIYLKIRKLEVGLELLLQEVIVGNEDVDIAKLIQQLNSRHWVEEGLNFLEVSGDVCPFCQNHTINDHLKEQFEKLFDETYKKKIAEIVRLQAEYQEVATVFLANLNEIQEFYNSKNLVSNQILELKKLFDENLKAIEYKKLHANEQKSLIVSLRFL